MREGHGEGYRVERRIEGNVDPAERAIYGEGEQRGAEEFEGDFHNALMVPRKTAN